MRSLVLAALLAFGTGACATGAALRAESEVIRSQLDAARQAGAYRCAPRELAIAESHLEFLEVELDEGNAVRAAAHRTVAKESLVTVLAKSKGCKPEVAPTPADRDGDGIPDENDACPDEPGPVELIGCPDRDGDGIADNVDKCPDVPEDKDGVADEDGCPETEDRDLDGIMDNVDKCPDVPEDKDGWEDEDGCPDPDNDSDGILDPADKCPLQPETVNNYEDDDGCPDVKLDLVEVRRDIGKIEIKQKVFFDTGKATIKSVSFTLLNQVATVLKTAESMRVLVEGHTDSVGSDATNMKLSDARSESVRQYLIGQGVPNDRLTAQGFGETKPIESNRTAKGRELNRRVEFTILGE
jgi:outer membrane protein OmpA-like peptidoglycan-associated protein